MNPTSLRRFAKQHGTPGLLLVGVYLLAHHLWSKRRRTVVACTLGLFAITYTISNYDRPPGHVITSGGYELYVRNN
jgi:hypothetical protein